MNFPYGDPITIITRTQTGTDDLGNPVYEETTLTRTGAFDPAIGFESTNGQDQVSSQPQALLPYDTAVDSNSVLVIRGKRYEVDGEPAPWRHPSTGWEAGLQVPLKRVTG